MAHQHQEESKNPADADEPSFLDIAGEHIETYVGPIDIVVHELASPDIHIDVHVVQPTEKQPFLTLVTTGMSEQPMPVPLELAEYKYAELVICVEPERTLKAGDVITDYWPINWLKFLARYPFRENTWIGPQHSIPNGDPPKSFSDNTKWCGSLLLPSFFFGKEFAQLKVSEKKTVNFHQVIPLYEEEMNFKIKHGTEALWDQFQKRISKSTFFDLKRPNACAKRWGIF